MRNKIYEFLMYEYKKVTCYYYDISFIFINISMTDLCPW